MITRGAKSVLAYLKTLKKSQFLSDKYLEKN